MTLFTRIGELISRYGSLRGAGRAVKIDPAYLLRLRVGTKTEPSDKVLKKLRLRRVVTYARSDGDHGE